MKKYIMIALLSLLFSGVKAQNDTLIWKIFDFVDFDVFKGTFKSLSGGKYDLKDNPVFYFGIEYENVSDKTYPSGDTLYFSGFFVTAFNDTIEYSQKTVFQRDATPTLSEEDSYICVNGSKKMDFTKLPVGVHTLTMWVTRNSSDGDYSDSIQKLSAHTITFEIVNTSSVPKHLSSNVSVYPNPARSQLTVSSDKEMHCIRALDTQGKEVGYWEVSGKSSLLDISNYASGIYTFKVETESGTEVQKVTVQ